MERGTSKADRSTISRKTASGPGIGNDTAGLDVAELDVIEHYASLGMIQPSMM